MRLINSLMFMWYHLNVYHNKFSFEEWIDFRRMKKIKKQMEREQKKRHTICLQ